MNRQRELDQVFSTSFDLAVIGGGATGCGIALDAASRGLSVVLCERGDIASGTSSRSTKLLHGGVRYLELAVKQLDPGQFHLVKEALHERSTLLEIAPHLTRVIELVTPLYSWWQIPYYTSGLKLYDLLAGSSVPTPSRFIGRQATIDRCPRIRQDGLRGAVVYSDGQFDDARMCLALAIGAKERGARILSYVELTKFSRTHGKISALHVRDTLTDRSGTIQAKAVINATGPYSDRVRQMAEPRVAPIISASSGSHITLPKHFSGESGLLIPKTDDGRVLFVLPWLGYTLVGTTDNPSEVIDRPQASEVDIDFILSQVRKYLDPAPTRADVLSAWSGLRPLIHESAQSSTAKLSRDHHLEVLTSGLVTIGGGKWTTYRRMAQDAVDAAIDQGPTNPSVKPCTTENQLLPGAEGYRKDGHLELANSYRIDPTTAERLYARYGSRAANVLELAKESKFERIHPDHDFLVAEVTYATANEFAHTADDVLDRRLRVGFLDSALKEKLKPRVQELLVPSPR